MKQYEIFYILYLFLIFISSIKGQDDCNTCTIIATSCTGTGCNPNCRSKYRDSGIICKFCNFNGENFYEIDDSDVCTVKSNCGASQKIVHESNECVNLCPTNSYKMGDYCYYTQPTNTECDMANHCNCQYKYYITNNNKEEYHCLSLGVECRDGYDYYYNNQCGGNSLCNSKKIKIEHRNDGSVIYRCSDSCYVNENEISENYCVDDCTSLSKKYYYPDENNDKYLECKDNCPNGLQDANNKCVNHCPSGFYNINSGVKICIDESSSSTCFYSQSEINLSDKRCYSTCTAISADYIYKKGQICFNTDTDCNYRSDDTPIKECYDTKQACKDAGYNYYQNKKCLSACTGYEDGDAPDDTLKTCFIDVAKCIENNYIYYTESPNKCYRSGCPPGFYRKYPQQNGGYLCKECTSTNEKISKNFCKENCDADECYFPDNTNSGNINPNICNPISNHFYYIDTTLKICVDNCKSIGKFYFDGNKKCQEKCKKTTNGEEVFTYYNPTDNKCVEQCDYNLFAKKPTGDHEKCDSKCPDDFKHLIQNTHQCLSSCPNTHPYDFEDANFDTNGHYICKTITSCTGSNYLFLDHACRTPDYCKENNKKFIDSNNICKSECDPGFPYKEKVIEDVYKCLQSCNKYIIEDTNECVQECPSTKNYIGQNNICKIGCGSTDGEKYYELKKIGENSIFKCVSECPQGYLLQTNNLSDKRCYKQCQESHKYLLPGSNKCYDLCKDLASTPFSLTYIENSSTKNICAASCNDRTPNYEENDKICKSGCNAGNNVIDYDNKCVTKCNKNEIIYKYNLDGKCVDNCSGNKNRIYFDNSRDEYICISKCESSNNFVLNGECVPLSPTKCDSSQYYLNPVLSNRIETGEYECVLNCPKIFFRSETMGSDNVKKCLDQCDITEYALIDTFECVSSCQNPSYYTYTPGYIYLFNACVKTCPEDKPYLNENTCVNTCQEKYLEDNVCKDSCSDDKFYVGQFLSNDPDKENRCLNDCPQKYPYYIPESNKYICSHECPSNLKFHKNDNPAIVGMECISTCPNNDYKYLSDDEKECLKSCPPGKYYVPEVGQKCLSQCPDNKPYHNKNEYECKAIEDCPNKFIDYEKKLCINSCNGFKYKYEQKDENDNTQILYTVCLNDCSIFSKYLTPSNICVDSCEPTNNLEIDDTLPFKCKCKYKYYFDNSNSNQICLDENKECKDIPSYQIQKDGSDECLNKCNKILSLDGDICYTEENKCGEYTQIIRASNGQRQCQCLNKYYINDSNKKQCLASTEKCPGDRAKYIPSTKQCVDECPSTQNKIFQNFCLDQCPQGAILSAGDNVCSCPDNKNWYSISDTNFECLPGTCPEFIPLLIDDTKQCVSECKNTEYPHLVGKKCYANCGSLTNTFSAGIDSYANDYNFATLTCRCNNLWYFDERQNINICPTGSDIKNTCKEFAGKNFNFLVKSTNQCVASCPSDYSYSFNDECFNSCLNANEEYHYDVKTNGDSKICICNNLWKYEIDSNNNKKIICLSDDECPSNALEIFDTRQCLEFGESDIIKCPNESPLELNKRCYKENNCPINSHYDPNINGKCVCDNLWYLTEDNKIHCMENNTLICPNDYPYEIFKTKECIKPVESTDTKCPVEYPYVFNYICYENTCPEFSKTKDSTKFCICDETKGLWYNKINPDNEKLYLYCGKEECPNNDPNKHNLLEEKKQCTFNCDEDGEEVFIYSFRNLCYEECPEFTKKDETQKKCIFYKLEEAKDLEELNNYVSVQVKELYESGPKGGIIFNNEDLSLQIYPYNKNIGNTKDKGLTLRSNLTYIDLNTCLNKIFEDQKLEDDDQIFVVKYDLFNKKKEKTLTEGEGKEEPPEKEIIDIKNSENYLINEVEYEFYSSKTLKKIDVSVCEPKEIIISYPITYTLAKFDSTFDNMNTNEYRQKFNLGKEIYHKNNDIDIFNFNNSVYKELCMPLEINGKDLVLESRYEVLYPNNITLCEKNCTYFYTDYELGRINCKCDYKEVLDFNREMPAESDLLNDPNFYKPTQSGANGEIIKCLSNLPNKDSIIKNEGFYFSTVVLAGEIGMVLVTAFYGINAVKGIIYNLGRKNIEGNNMNNNNKINNNKNIRYQNENVISTTNRILESNPPKKNDNNENQNQNKTFNIIKKKTLFNVRSNNNINNKNNSLNQSDDSNDENINYGLEIKSINIYPKNNKSNNYEDIKFKKIDDIRGKAEFIPPDYNFKFFKISDNGIIKKIERSQIPFQIKSSTKYLLEQKENVDYHKNYLNGPIYENQNMIEIIDEEEKDKQEKELEEKEENGGNKKLIKRNIRNEKNFENRIKVRQITTDNSFINIRAVNQIKKIDENDDDYFEDDKENTKKFRENVSLFYLIKREQSMLKMPYEKYIEKDHSNLLSIILAEIFDKFYLIQIFCFLKPYEIFSAHLFNYFLYHILLLSLLCCFFTISTIKRIFTDSNFPQLNFYLLYGLISSIIIWIIYKLFLWLIDHRDRVNDLIKIRQELNKKDNNEEISEELYDKKYNELIKKIKIFIAVFFIIGILLTGFCFIYLVTFCAIYTGTKSKVFKAYYITLIELSLIKLVYGLCLASLRKAGETNEFKKVYMVPYICNKYIS